MGKNLNRRFSREKPPCGHELGLVMVSGVVILTLADDHQLNPTKQFRPPIGQRLQELPANSAFAA